MYASFSLSDLDAFQQKGANYLSRLKMNTKLFQKMSISLSLKIESSRKNINIH